MQRTNRAIQIQRFESIVMRFSRADCRIIVSCLATILQYYASSSVFVSLYLPFCSILLDFFLAISQNVIWSSNANDTDWEVRNSFELAFELTYSKSIFSSNAHSDTPYLFPSSVSPIHHVHLGILEENITSIATHSLKDHQSLYIFLHLTSR